MSDSTSSLMYTSAENNDYVPNCRLLNLLTALFAHLASSAICGTMISLDLLTITVQQFFYKSLDKAKHEILETEND